MTDTIAAYRQRLVDELARLDAQEASTRSTLQAVARPPPTGVYGRPGIRAVDGMRIDEVVCGSGDGDCMFPNCGCGRTHRRAPAGPDLSKLPPLPAELAALLSEYRDAISRVARVFPLIDEAVTAEFEINNNLVTAIRMAIAKQT